MQILLVPQNKPDYRVTELAAAQSLGWTPTVSQVYALTRIPDFTSSQTTKERGLWVWFILKHDMKRGFH